MYAIKVTGIYTPILTNVGYIYISYLRPGLRLIGFDPNTKEITTAEVIKVRRSLTVSSSHAGIHAVRYWLVVTKDDKAIDKDGDMVNVCDLTEAELNFCFPRELFEGQHNPHICKSGKLGLLHWNPEFRKVREIHSEISTNSRPLAQGFFKITFEEIKKFLGNRKRVEINIKSILVLLNFLEMALRAMKEDSVKLIPAKDRYSLSFELRDQEKEGLVKVNSSIYCEPIKDIITVSNTVITEKPIYFLTAGLVRG